MSSTVKAKKPPAGGTSKVSASKGSVGAGGSDSKRAMGGGGNNSGFAGTPSNFQVTYLGKIATPQSLIPRKTSSGKDPSKKTKSEPPALAAVPIDETKSEITPLKKFSRSTSSADIGASKPKGHLGHRSSTTLDKKANAGFGTSFGVSGMAEKNQVEEFVSINLTETPTEVLLKLTSLVAASDTREIAITDERNARYEALVFAHKNPDNYVARPTQTMNNPAKNQNEMTAPNASRDFGSQAASFDILDSTKTLDRSSNDDSGGLVTTSIGTGDDDGGDHISGGELDEATAALSSNVRSFVTDTINVASVYPGCLLDTSSVNKPDPPSESRAAEGRRIGDAARAGKGGSRHANAGYSTAAGSSGGTSAVDASGFGMPPQAPSSAMPQDASGSRVSDEGQGHSLQGGVSTAGGGDKANTVEFLEQDSALILQEKHAASVLASKSLWDKLLLVERAIQQNIYHTKHLDYRNLPNIEPLSSAADGVYAVDSLDQLFGSSANLRSSTQSIGGSPTGIAPTDGSETPAADEGNSTTDPNASNPNLGSPAQSAVPHAPTQSNYVRKLFHYVKNDLVQGRSVTAISWNHANPDLMAVGYGRLDSALTTEVNSIDEEKSRGGLVLFWSLRNPDYPERILRTNDSVTALDFSKNSPSILAVGMYNGELAIYNVKKGSDLGTPIESSQNIASGTGGVVGHSDPIWDLKWVTKSASVLSGAGESRHEETIVTISTDGLVLEWNVKKGLTVSTLMQLRRGGSGEGWISRSAAGLSFDFLPGDSSRYITGTEEGSVHLSNVSHNEQYLESYAGHNGPVYKVRFSKACPEIFISCSADWTVSLYHIRAHSPLLSLHTTGADFAICDLCWCPGNSTVFAAVTADAKIQLWDLSVSCIDPVTVINTAEDTSLLSALGMNLAPIPEAENNLNTTSASAAMNLSRAGTADRPEVTTTVSPVKKLLKSLATLESSKRQLSVVTFNPNSPILVVGDTKGAITVYRVLNPVACCDDTAAQQSQSLKRAVERQADPSVVAKLYSKQ